MKRALRLFAWSYIAYLALVVLVLWPVLNTVPHWFVENTFGRQLRTEFIYFNPFTLDLEIRHAELPERDGSPFFSVRRVSVNLSTESLWQRGLVLDAIRVEDLFLRVHRLASGEFTFADLLPPEEPEAPAPEEPTAIPALTVHDLDFHAARIQYLDDAREEPYSSHLDNLAIRIQELSTVAEEGRPYQLYAEGERGGTLEWKGTVSIPASTSEGSLALSNLDLHAFWRLVKPLVTFELVTGRLDARGRYRVDWADDIRYRIDDGSVRLRELDIRPQAADSLPDTRLGLGELALEGISLDGAGQRVDIGAASVGGLAVEGWSEGSRVSLAELFAPRPGGSAPADAAAAEPAAPGWQVALGALQLGDSSLRWRSEFTEPALLTVTPITAVIRGIQWPPSGDTALELGLTVNGTATLSVDATLNLADGNGRLDYALAGLPATWFTPNFPAELHAEITQGEIQAEGTATLSGFAPVTIGMQGAFTDFSGRLRDATESLTSWKAIRWRDLMVDLAQQQVTLGKLTFDTYSGRLHINQDGTINAQKLWVAEPAVAAAPAAAAPEAAAPWAVAVSLIEIADSQIDFKDDSLPIGFRTVVGELNGEIRGLSSTAGAEAKVDIEGTVDGYAPVSLMGTAAPLGDPPAIDLALDFTGVDLATLTPYSATYAGYAIDQGLLTLNLKYRLKDGTLQGNNKVLIDKMELGEQIDSDQSLDLPIKLALALLTDSNGVIDLEVPVSGDVNNPDFSIGSVLARAFVNLITKAVTAPFTLLANLVDSEDDLQRVSFPSGSAVLTERGRNKLQQLYDAMSQRPALVLEINGRVRPGKDRERLQRNALKADLLAAGLSPEDIEGRTPAWENAVAQRCEEAGIATAELSPMERYRALAQTIPVTDEELLALAQARAVAVKTWLVKEAGLGADRAVVGKASLRDEGNTFSGVELGVDT